MAVNYTYLPIKKQDLRYEGMKIITMLKVNDIVAPIFLYHSNAITFLLCGLTGTDVDQPRNLAKSVTVE